MTDWVTTDETHSVPPTSSDDRGHVLDASCWCAPTVTRREGGIDIEHHSSTTHP